jgi:hypothetical protein
MGIYDESLIKGFYRVLGDLVTIMRGIDRKDLERIIKRIKL